MVAVSSASSASWAALTVTVWATFQFWSVKVRVVGSAVTSELSVGSFTVTVTSPRGWLPSTTV